MSFDSHSLESRLLLALTKAADTPRSLTMWMLWKYDELEQFVNIEVDALDYVDPCASIMFPLRGVVNFQKDLLVSSYYSKRSDLVIDGVDRRKAAIQSFLEGERQNRETNKRIQAIGVNPPSAEVLAVLNRAARGLSQLLRQRSLIDFVRGSRFGPKSTAALPRAFATRWAKTVFVGDVTPAASQLAVRLLSEDLHRLAAVRGTYDDPSEATQADLKNVWKPRLKLVNGHPEHVWRDGRPVGSWANRPVTSDLLVFVDKNAKTHRTITAQPGVNLELQYAVSDPIRKSLRRWGIDLTDQSANQRAAREASLWSFKDQDLAVCTVDLKNASNLNAIRMVQLLFSDLHNSMQEPVTRHVYRAMYQVRTTHFVHPVSKRPTPYEMFSAMGNGFTFELETAVFAAVARACEPEDASRVRVYGDDIIVTRRAYPLLKEVLTFIGHTVNARKSHTTGLYYESCGHHYFNGRYVTPVYQKVSPDASVFEAIRCHNRLARFACRVPSGHEQASHGPDGAIEMADWLIPALKTVFNHIVEACVSQGRRVPIQPLGREVRHIHDDVVAMEKAVYLTAWTALGCNPKNSPRPALYESDSGVALGFNALGGFPSYKVQFHPNFGYRTTGYQSKPPEEVQEDQWAAYAACLRLGSARSKGGTPQDDQDARVGLGTVHYRDGWADTRFVGS